MDRLTGEEREAAAVAPGGIPGRRRMAHHEGLEGRDQDLRPEGAGPLHAARRRARGGLPEAGRVHGLRGDALPGLREGAGRPRPARGSISRRSISRLAAAPFEPRAASPLRATLSGASRSTSQCEHCSVALSAPQQACGLPPSINPDTATPPPLQCRADGVGPSAVSGVAVRGAPRTSQYASASGRSPSLHKAQRRRDATSRHKDAGTRCQARASRVRSTLSRSCLQALFL